ncbi:putative ABC transport system permease protein [Dysgonomonas sp. PFB1-18]|uniref:ABC transporter permease n=1 Tax=unclassified Dysgonomonas TaxID=2630389 RepID=UPI002474243E|nr:MULTISPECIES: ABC transporter permease [unclassified Dysgonomonas]MDH6308562.1 putative ABC transport system permease protein [Dysgonomonas sp. PF1-14]MDH6338063.1 putative ABC transport system permease protein [Dysgonomonas sp. PF1-16]MDH6379560.1 putative ABC transport system permease protein [Dysgonomonas sp. PFB1-18]MDH6396890.1 putative ABC transport system permease protein [Dysgonomonas sp. PF1-23]
MFDFDSLREILSTIGKNKLRTFLTGLAVAWGIFMLIILLAAGNGFRNAMMSNFSDRAKNTVTLWPGRTSMPHDGLPSGRSIRFDYKDYDLIKNKIQGVEKISVRISQSSIISYEKEYGSWTLDGVTPDAGYINNVEVTAGRFINKMDIEARRKVIVISEDTKKVLFKDEDALGKHVIATGIAYQVIGIYSVKNQFRNDMPTYIPFTTAQMLYNKGYGFNQIEFTIKDLKTEEENEAFIEMLRGKMGDLHGFNPKDRSALYIRNTAEDSMQAENIFFIINVFILVIGAASLMAGIVGVGNIMLITVKERTKEIGIRKAIGASPASVLRLIIFESILITATAGYIGMVFGIALTEIINLILSMAPSDGSPSMLQDTTVDLATVMWATLVLIVCGTVAGLMPAMKATRISPIEAMRSE